MRHLTFLLLSWAAAFPAFGGALIFLQTPDLETLADSAVTWRLVPAPGDSASLDSCGIYTARLPLGPRLEGRTRLPQTEDTTTQAGLQITFTPAEGLTGPQLALGVHYLVAACGDGASLSPEVPLRVATSRPATVLTPRSEETSSRPEITWTRVPGVPAYHLLLSDQALRIDSGGGVSGASIIWQAITASDRILYGAADPSGNFSKVAAPPLVPGVEYNLAILNNYDGKTALQSSAKAQAVKLFAVKPTAAALAAPQVLQPARGASFRAPDDSVIPYR